MTSTFSSTRRVCRGAAVVFLLVFHVQPPAAAADDLLAMVSNIIEHDDAEFRAVGLERIRDGVKGEGATRVFTALLDKQPATRQVELIQALAERGDNVAVAPLRAVLATTQHSDVRAAALAAIGKLGGGDDVALLMKSLTAGEPERSAARQALVTIRGDEARHRIVSATKTGDSAVRAMMIDILSERRERTTLPNLRALAADPDTAVRNEAIKALGKMGGAAEVPLMVLALLKTAPGGLRQEAERAVIAVCTKNLGHEEAARTFLNEFEAATEGDQEILLATLAGIGSPAAIAIVDELLESPDAAKRSMGLKAMSRWRDATICQRLLDLVGKVSDEADRDLLVNSLIRLAPLPENKLDDAHKLDLVKQTMALCNTDAERANLLERVNAIRTVDALRFVLPYLDQAALAAAACKSVVELAHHQKLRDAHKAEFVAALDKVLATTHDAELIERANRYKEGRTWERKR